MAIVILVRLRLPFPYRRYGLPYAVQLNVGPNAALRDRLAVCPPVDRLFGNAYIRENDFAAEIASRIEHVPGFQPIERDGAVSPDIVVAKRFAGGSIQAAGNIYGKLAASTRMKLLVCKLRRFPH